MSNFLLFLTMYQLHSYNYYPFGSPMPERSFSSPSYRYGFNGMEKDDEVKGSSGTSYDFGARMYDSRLGRWMSLDPLAGKFPFSSPYVGMADNPILLVDEDGKEPNKKGAIGKKAYIAIVTDEMSFMLFQNNILEEMHRFYYGYGNQKQSVDSRGDKSRYLYSTRWGLI